MKICYTPRFFLIFAEAHVQKYMMQKYVFPSLKAAPSCSNASDPQFLQLIPPLLTTFPDKQAYSVHRLLRPLIPYLSGKFDFIMYRTA